MYEPPMFKQCRVLFISGTKKYQCPLLTEILFPFDPFKQSGIHLPPYLRYFISPEFEEIVIEPVELRIRTKVRADHQHPFSRVRPIVVFRFHAVLPVLLLGFRNTLFDNLGKTSLYSKIILGKSDLFFSTVAVLCHQVTGVACKEYVIYHFFSA